MGVAIGDAAERVLERALAVYPAERWQTVGAFWAALRAAIADVRPRRDPEAAAPLAAPASPAQPSVARASPGRGRRHAAPLAARAVAVLLALALAASAVSDHGVRSPESEVAVALRR
jgi:hypothetical protein